MNSPRVSDTVCSHFAAKSVIVVPNMSESASARGHLLVRLTAKMKKSDRGSGWVNELPVCQSEGVPSRDLLRFAPLATC